MAEKSALPMGRQFMLNLLVRSLMADGGIEEAVITAICDGGFLKAGVDDKGKPITADVAATPLLQLVQQLLNNLTLHQMTYFKQVTICAYTRFQFEPLPYFSLQLLDVTMSGEEELSTLQPDRPAIDLLLVFQKTVQTIVFTEYMNITETQDKEKGISQQISLILPTFKKHINNIIHHILTLFFGNYRPLTLRDCHQEMVSVLNRAVKASGNDLYFRTNFSSLY